MDAFLNDITMNGIFLNPEDEDFLIYGMQWMEAVKRRPVASRYTYKSNRQTDAFLSNHSLNT